MKTQEYIKKYGLNESNKFDHSAFVQDLANEFISLLEINKANDNLKGFDNAVRCIKMKFGAIENKTLGVFPEKLWGFFFATVIVKLREELCPKQMDKIREEKAARKREYDERKAWEKKQFFDWDSHWSANFNALLFARYNSMPKPVESFVVLGLSENANEEEVAKAFKKLAMTHHPDKGGKQDLFVQMVESKNKCLQWLETQKKV